MAAHGMSERQGWVEVSGPLLVVVQPITSRELWISLGGGTVGLVQSFDVPVSTHSSESQMLPHNA